MREQESQQTEIPDTSHLEDLLGLLRDLSQHDPPPALRERLADLSSCRLRASGYQHQKRLVWVKPVLAAVMLIAVGLTAAWVANLSQRKSLRAGTDVQSNLRGALSGKESHSMPNAPLPKASLKSSSEINHTNPAPKHGPRRMVIQLPYSNRSIASGTDATIRVSMSQFELMSLGFPVNATLDDRRVVAELTLGDDGLPRAISVPLPLEVMKEKK